MLSKMWWSLVRFGFRLLYNEMAFTYDMVSWVVSLGQWRCWQRTSMQFLPDAESGLILELAHGTGNLQIDLQQTGYHTVAFDLSPYMGRIAKRKLVKNNLVHTFVQGSAFQLPFADQSFSAIVSTFPTDFIVQSETLNEVYRVLQNESKLIVVFNGVLTGGGIVQSFLEWLYRITGQRENDDHQDYTHKYFEGCGFGVEEVTLPCKNSIARLMILTKNNNKQD
jgi:ubiquinone/menaquinone biosynthesis C-methylase UbiE